MHNKISYCISLYLFFTVCNASNRKIRMYSFYTPSHTIFKDEWFLPTLQDDFEVIIKKYPQECEKAQWMRPGWTTTTLHKIELILQAIEDNWNDFFIYADIDIQFIQPIEHIITSLMHNNDMIFQQHNPQGTVCSGFFVCRANEKTKQFFLAVHAMMLNNKRISDQPAINTLLIVKKNPFNIIWQYLPSTFFGGGTLRHELKAWGPGMVLDFPPAIVLHHANCTRGVKNKIAQLRYIRKAVNHSTKV